MKKFDKVLRNLLMLLKKLFKKLFKDFFVYVGSSDNGDFVIFNGSISM